MNVLDQVVSFIADQNVDAYFVGGIVRDELMQRATKRDIDLAIDGDAVEIARAFADAQCGAFYLMDEEHNVARVILSDTYIDFAQLRGTLREDLSTRDFTINAMARQIGSNELSDPFRMLRAVRLAGELDFTIGAHTEKLIQRDASLLAFASMERARDELCKILALPDPIPSLRQMDHLGLLAALLPQVTALKAITQSPPHTYDVFEHTLHVIAELVKIQAENYAAVANNEFSAELTTHFAQTISADRKRATLLRLAALLHDIGKATTHSIDAKGAIHFYEHEPRGAEMSDELLRHLRFSNAEIEIVNRVVTHHLRPAQLARDNHVSNRAAYRFFRDTGDAGIDTCVLALADWRGKAAIIYSASEQDARQRATNTILLDRYYRAPEIVIKPPAIIDGNVLIKELRLQPGPRIGELLEAIREAQAAGEVSTQEDAIAFAMKQVDK